MKRLSCVLFAMVSSAVAFAGSFSSDRILVAASNSLERDKEAADFLCSGVNDERVIQRAIDECGIAGNVVLLPGRYNLDEFIDYPDADEPSCIRIPYYESQPSYGGNYNYVPCISLRGSALEGGAVLCVTEKALESLGADRQGSVLNISNCYPANTVKVGFSNFIVSIADNVHKVIGINTYRAGCCGMESIRLYQQGYGIGKMPARGSVGVRCTNGNPNGVGQEMIHVFAIGFYEGFQMGGEHLVAIECGARNCYYGYTFGNYDFDYGVAEHPITLINCCDELNAALPLFASCGASVQEEKRGLQQVDMIGFNIELRPKENPTLAPVIPAREITPSSFCGRIEFVANRYAYSYQNSVDVQFWEEGSGHNFKTSNAAHKAGGTTAERLSYTPMYMQQYYDTDLRRMLLYDGSEWVDMKGGRVRGE